MRIDGSYQLWVADITYVAIAEGFAYVAVILAAWSRRVVVGYQIRLSIDVRLPAAEPLPESMHDNLKSIRYATTCLL